MNVLYLGGFRLPDKNAAAHRVISNTKILLELGHKVWMVGQDVEISNREILETFNSNVVMYNDPYPNGIISWINYIWDINRIKRLIVENSINLVILYNYPSFATLRLLPYLKKRNIKVVADCTEWYGSPDGSIIKKIIKKLDTSLRMRLVNFNIDGIITISKYLTDYYKGVKTIELPPLVDLKDNKFKCLDRTIDSSIINFVYAGQMGNKDRINEVLNMLAIIREDGIKNFKFNIIGTDEKSFIENNIITYKYKDFVNFFGRLSHNEVIKKVALSDFVVFLREDNRVNNAGFPTKFVEAMSCGTPVITNSTSNISEYLKEGVNGFFIEGDYEQQKIKFKSILGLSKNRIIELKQNCSKNNSFYYREYIEKFNMFLSNL